MWETSRESYLAAKAAELSKCDQAVKPDQEEWEGKFFRRLLSAEVLWENTGGLLS